MATSVIATPVIFDLIGISYAILPQDLLLADYSAKLTDVGPADHRQHVDVRVSHLLQCEAKRMIGMNIRVCVGLDEIAHRAGRVGGLDRLLCDQAANRVVVAYGP